MIVADASALVKLVLHEPQSEFALDTFQQLIIEGETISSPEIAFSESLNVIWKHYILLKNISKADFDAAVQTFTAIWERIDHVPVEKLYTLALELAVANRINMYDSLYLAQCKLNDGRLFTFDIKLLEKAKAIGLKSIKV